MTLPRPSTPWLGIVLIEIAILIMLAVRAHGGPLRLVYTFAVTATDVNWLESDCSSTITYTNAFPKLAWDPPLSTNQIDHYTVYRWVEGLPFVAHYSAVSNGGFNVPRSTRTNRVVTVWVNGASLSLTNPLGAEEWFRGSNATIRLTIQ